MKRLQEAEARAFKALNALTTPWIRYGFGSLSLQLAGLTVLETTGRTTGNPHETPLQALFFPGGAVVATHRAGRSDWLKNAATRPSVRYWVDGRPREATAEVCTTPGGWAVAVLRDSR